MVTKPLLLLVIIIFVSTPSAKADWLDLGWVFYNCANDKTAYAYEKTVQYKNTYSSFKIFTELLHQGLTNNSIDNSKAM